MFVFNSMTLLIDQWKVQLAYIVQEEDVTLGNELQWCEQRQENCISTTYENRSVTRNSTGAEGIKQAHPHADPFCVPSLESTGVFWLEGCSISSEPIDKK